MRSAIALNPWCVFGAMLVFPTFFGGACGSDNADSSGSSAKSSEQAEPRVFTSEVAGDACAEDKDCGNGTCTSVFSDLFGGSRPAPGGYCTFRCQLDADCGDAAACIGASGGGFALGGDAASTPGSCLLRCETSAACRDGYRCFDALGQALDAEAGADGQASGTCQIAPETDTLGAGVAGNACAADEDCAGGRCMTSDLLMTDYPEGYCSGSCLSDGDCGEGGTCSTAFGGMAGTCYRSCETDADCSREGYRCRSTAFPQGAAMRCLPGSDPLPDGVVGTTCAQDADCGGSFGAYCALTLPTPSGEQASPDGYCSVSCLDDADCGVDGKCAGSFGGITMGACYQGCAEAGDCRDGYACAMPSLAGLGNAGNFGGFMGAMGANGIAGLGGMQPTVCTLPQGTDDQDAGVP